MRAAVFGVIGLWGAAMASASAPQLRDLIWTDPAADRALVLTHPPRECLVRQDPEVEAGRALFRSRNLLGGPAARVGLSCESCHTNGRTNSHFLLPELTNVAGAADVTSEWSSKVRGDGILNPKPIPDLAGAGTKDNFGSSKDPSLAHFVRSVIEDEFQGPPLRDETMGALLAYIRALDRCSPAPSELHIRDVTQDVRRAASAAGAMAAKGDEATASLTLLATQDALARLVERLAADDFGQERLRLEMLARELGAARDRTPLRDTLPDLLPNWMKRFDHTARKLERHNALTFADRHVLQKALEVGNSSAAAK